MRAPTQVPLRATPPPSPSLSSSDVYELHTVPGVCLKRLCQTASNIKSVVPRQESEFLGPRARTLPCGVPFWTRQNYFLACAGSLCRSTPLVSRKTRNVYWKGVARAFVMALQNELFGARTQGGGGGGTWRSDLVRCTVHEGASLGAHEHTRRRV